MCNKKHYRGLLLIMLYFGITWAAITLLTTLIDPSSTSSPPNICKATPGSCSWPSAAEWEALNHTVGGRLLKPLPTASVCHSNEPDFNLEICKTTPWTDASTYANNPIGIINPNWSNDSCLPQPNYPCSGEGFPVYVINATSAGDVAAGVNFARNHNIRLNVKGSGHDYLGRSNAPFSLSIWTKHMSGIVFHESFVPDGCKSCSAVSAVTLGAGEDWCSIYKAAHAFNLTLVGGTGDTIGLGGYLTGGGHSPLSAKFGLAVDQVLSMEVVLPSGDFVLANQALNPDVFWAMRGGGGATFGVMTSVTLKTYPDMPVAQANVIIAGKPNSEEIWNATTFLISQSPRLQESGIMGYCYISSAIPINGTTVGGYLGAFLLPNGTQAELQSATAFAQEYIASIPGLEITFTPVAYPSLYAWYEANKNVAPIGYNERVGNRLLDAKALSNVTALRKAIEVATPPGTLANLNLVAGPGLWKAVPAGGSDSVTPAWRKSYVEYAVPVLWPYLNNTAGQIQASLLTNVYMQALRDLAPDTGSYLNEGDVNEPDFEQAYWGDNYPRLLSIKRSLDPEGVFWCAACVGRDAWQEVDNVLCRA